MILRLSIVNADLTEGEVPVFVEAPLDKADFALSCEEFDKRLTAPMTAALLRARLGLKPGDVSVRVELEL